MFSTCIINYFVDFDTQIIINAILLFVTLILNLEVAEVSFSEERTISSSPLYSSLALSTCVLDV